MDGLLSKIVAFGVQKQMHPQCLVRILSWIGSFFFENAAGQAINKLMLFAKVVSKFKMDDDMMFTRNNSIIARLISYNFLF